MFRVAVYLFKYNSGQSLIPPFGSFTLFLSTIHSFYVSQSLSSLPLIERWSFVSDMLLGNEHEQSSKFQMRKMRIFFMANVHFPGKKVHGSFVVVISRESDAVDVGSGFESLKTQFVFPALYL